MRSRERRLSIAPCSQEDEVVAVLVIMVEVDLEEVLVRLYNEECGMEETMAV